MCGSQCFFSALKSSIIIIKDRMVMKKKYVNQTGPPSSPRGPSSAKRPSCIVATGTVFQRFEWIGGGPVLPHRNLVHRVLLLLHHHGGGCARTFVAVYDDQCSCACVRAREDHIPCATGIRNDVLRSLSSAVR